MKTITSCVEDYIRSKPFLQTVLSKGVINLSSLARVMMPEIEQKINKKVQEGAVIMALRRLSTHMEFRLSHKVARVISNISEINVRSQITDYSFALSDETFDKQMRLLSLLKNHKNSFYNSSKGVDEFNIVISNYLNNKVEKIFESEKCLQKLENLSAISIRLPQENVQLSGIYHYIFQKIAWEGIVINEIISTSNVFTIVLSEAQADLAFKTINNLKSI